MTDKVTKYDINTDKFQDKLNKLISEASCNKIEEMVFHKIEKLSVVPADSVEIEIIIIALTSLKRKNLPNLIRRLLRSYRLTNCCVIKLNEKDQRRTGVFSIKVLSGPPVFRLNQDARIEIKEIINKKRVDLLQKGKAAEVPLGGIGNLREKMTRALSEKRNVLISGPAGSGKTALVNSTASSLGIACLHCDCSALARPQPGEAEAVLRAVWEEARECEAVLVLDSVEMVSTRGGRADRGCS